MGSSTRKNKIVLNYRKIVLNYCRQKLKQNKVNDYSRRQLIDGLMWLVNLKNFYFVSQYKASQKKRIKRGSCKNERNASLSPWLQLISVIKMIKILEIIVGIWKPSFML